jgi:hypothetical protein
MLLGPLASMWHVVFVACLALACVSPAAAQNRASRAASLKLDETLWRLAGRNRALVGLERPDGAVLNGEPMITGNIERDLDSLVSQMDGYEWRVVDGVYVVRPSEAWADPTDILARRTPAVNWQDIGIRRAPSEVAKLFYGDDDGREPEPTKRRFSVTLPNSTLIHVLNAIAVQHGGLLWIVRSIPAAPPRVGVVLRDFDGTTVGFTGSTPKPTR